MELGSDNERDKRPAVCMCNYLIWNITVQKGRVVHASHKLLVLQYTYWYKQRIGNYHKNQQLSLLTVQFKDFILTLNLTTNFYIYIYTKK